VFYWDLKVAALSHHPAVIVCGRGGLDRHVHDWNSLRDGVATGSDWGPAKKSSFCWLM